MTWCAHSCKQTLPAKCVIGQDLATTRSDELHANGEPRLHRINSSLVYSRNAWVSHVAGWSDVFFVHVSNWTRVVSHVDDQLICAKTRDLVAILVTRRIACGDQERRSGQSEPTCGISGV